MWPIHFPAQSPVRENILGAVRWHRSAKALTLRHLPVGTLTDTREHLFSLGHALEVATHRCNSHAGALPLWRAPAHGTGRSLCPSHTELLRGSSGAAHLPCLHRGPCCVLPPASSLPTWPTSQLLNPFLFS